MIRAATDQRPRPKLVTADSGPIGIEGDSSSVRLKSFIERVERLNEEKAATNADISEVFKEAKGTGFEPKIMKKIILLRAMDGDARREQEEMMDMYQRALGMIV